MELRSNPGMHRVIEQVHHFARVLPQVVQLACAGDQLARERAKATRTESRSEGRGITQASQPKNREIPTLSVGISRSMAAPARPIP